MHTPRHGALRRDNTALCVITALSFSEAACFITFYNILPVVSSFTSAAQISFSLSVTVINDTVPLARFALGATNPPDLIMRRLIVLKHPDKGEVLCLNSRGHCLDVHWLLQSAENVLSLVLPLLSIRA